MYAQWLQFARVVLLLGKRQKILGPNFGGIPSISKISNYLSVNVGYLPDLYGICLLFFSFCLGFFRPIVILQHVEDLRFFIVTITASVCVWFVTKNLPQNITIEFLYLSVGNITIISRVVNGGIVSGQKMIQTRH